MSSALAPLDVILVRHAEAILVGMAGVADDDRPLTDAGRAAASELAAELDGYEITAIYDSPFARSVETVSAIARRRGIAIQVLADLRERRLSPDPIPEWRTALEEAWADATVATGQPSMITRFHQQLTTKDAETRARMCHESLRPVWVVNTSHRAVGLSFVNNVFRHHT